MDSYLDCPRLWSRPNRSDPKPGHATTSRWATATSGTVQLLSLRKILVRPAQRKGFPINSFPINSFPITRDSGGSRVLDEQEFSEGGSRTVLHDVVPERPSIRWGLPRRRFWSSRTRPDGKPWVDNFSEAQWERTRRHALGSPNTEILDEAVGPELPRQELPRQEVLRQELPQKGLPKQQLSSSESLKLGMSGHTWEGDHVADVFHPRDELDGPFQA